MSVIDIGCYPKTFPNIWFFSTFRYDNLTIYSYVPSVTKRSQGQGDTYCGNTLPPNKLCEESYVQMLFKSDGSATFGGFEMMYTCVGNEKKDFPLDTEMCLQRSLFRDLFSFL